MYKLGNLLTVGPSLLLYFLSAPSAQAYTLRPNYLQSPSLPFQLAQHQLQPHGSRTFLTRWRDRIITRFWNVPIPQCQIGKDMKDAPISKIGPPPSLLSRYGGDMVLRFNISSADEAIALAEAIDVLILDVWEFTTDWADIRLSKDVVSLEGIL